MAATNGASASRPDSFRFLWIALRLAGGTLGVLTLLHVATFGLGVEYKVFFQDFIDRLRDWIDLAPLLDPIEKYVIHPVLEWLRSFGLAIPELAEHWRYVFTLTWLLMLALARHQQGNLVVEVVLAFVCALAVAAATGTVPLDSAALVLWPVAGFAFYISGHHLLSGRRPRDGWLSLLVGLTFVTFLILVGDGGSIQPVMLQFGIDVPAPGLLFWAGYVGLAGLFSLAMGLLEGHGRERWSDNRTASGLDIVGVMGAALTIGYVMMR